MANPTLLTMPMCVNADKNTIPPTDAGTSGHFSEELGFQGINSLPLASGGKAPNRRDFNGIFALLGGIAFMAQKGFTFNWDASQDYYAGCVVIDTTDGKRYECIADVAAGGSVPSADATHWQEFGGNGDGFEVGDIKIVAYNGTIQDKWFVCDGAAVSRDLYAKLYAKIGTTYGAGDGSTTFNLPDINAAGRFVQGSTTAGTEKQAGLPNIEGSISNMRGGFSSSNNVSVINATISRTGLVSDVVTTGTDNQGSAAGYNGYNTITLSAQNSNHIYGNSDTVQPPALTMRFLIKYEE